MALARGGHELGTIWVRLGYSRKRNTLTHDIAQTPLSLAALYKYLSIYNYRIYDRFVVVTRQTSNAVCGVGDQVE